jgi:DNA-binding HxlR family transcriptional regulator
MVAKSNQARKRSDGDLAKADPHGSRRLGEIRGQGPPVPRDLDRLIHERMRLAIVSVLAVHDALTFNELKDLVDATDGNLSVHARKLEEAGYLSCSKGFAGRVPRTEYRLTAPGRRALERYLDHMESLIQRTREG